MEKTIMPGGSSNGRLRGISKGAGTLGAPPVIVSLPMGWPQPPPPANSYYNSAQPAEMESLRKEKDDLANKLSFRNQEVEKLNDELKSLRREKADLTSKVMHVNQEIEKLNAENSALKEQVRSIVVCIEH